MESIWQNLPYDMSRLIISKLDNKATQFKVLRGIYEKLNDRVLLLKPILTVRYYTHHPLMHKYAEGNLIRNGIPIVNEYIYIYENESTDWDTGASNDCYKRCRILPITILSELQERQDKLPKLTMEDFKIRSSVYK